jgi:peptidoglycan/xylan/chitin deacetylase (PgdA/CDA1 family)
VENDGERSMTPETSIRQHTFARAFDRRRVMLAAGGLTLLGGCGAVAVKAADAGHTRVSGAPSTLEASEPPSQWPSPSPTPTSTPTARLTPNDVSSSTARPSTPPSDVIPTTPGGEPFPTNPEYYVHSGPKVIALTLDDGPDNLYTPQILTLLQRYGIVATFCMIGRQVSANPGVVREVAAAGHTVVNHTWDHADQSKLGLTQISAQIDRTNQAMADAEVTPKVFRAPYGAWSRSVYQACAAHYLSPLDWSVDPRDWSRPGVNAIVSTIQRQTRTGSIILEHDGGGDRSQTVAALRIVLPWLLDQGFRFTAV